MPADATFNRLSDLTGPGGIEPEQLENINYFAKFYGKEIAK